MSCPIPGLILPNDTCSQGHYCPNGTIIFDQFPCPPGTFTGSSNLTAPEECSSCPAMRACGWATGVDTNPSLPCRPGHYCPTGTPAVDRNPCPPGTFSNRSDLVSADECTPCLESFYCLGGGASPSAPCLPGYYCPQGTQAHDQFPCPSGRHNPLQGQSAIAACLFCTQGHFCEPASVRPMECPAGTYMPQGVYPAGHPLNGTLLGVSAGNKSECLPCPAGYFCGLATITPIGCGVGRFSSSGRSACDDCRAGHYCNSTNMTEASMLRSNRCPPGQYCPLGVDSLDNALPCAAGFYCPEGTSFAPALTSACAPFFFKC